MPMGEFKNFKDCVSKNKDKKNPLAYCASIMRKIEGEKTKNAEHGNMMETPDAEGKCPEGYEKHQNMCFRSDMFEDMTPEEKQDHIKEMLNSGKEEAKMVEGQKIEPLKEEPSVDHRLKKVVMVAVDDKCDEGYTLKDGICILNEALKVWNEKGKFTEEVKEEKTIGKSVSLFNDDQL